MRYVGLDWASESHDLTIIDDTATIIDRWAFTHDEAGITTTLARLAGHDDPGDLPVAIETSNGLLVERLLAAGHPVVPIHPNAFNATRPRWGASRAKTDPGDSYKLADYLRTEGHRLRRLALPDQATRDLQQLVRLRDDHVAAKVACTNQLAALLARHWPGAGTLFANLDSPIALAFLADYPTWASARRLGEARMAQFCHRYHYSGRRSPAELLARLRDAPQPAQPAISDTVAAQLVTAQATLLRSLLETIASLDKAITESTAAHPKTEVFAKLPRVGRVHLAQLLAEIGPILDRAVTLEQACAEAGVTPVTKASGKSLNVGFRYATNTRARQALTLWADNSRHAAPWAADAYQAARRRGKRHPHAVRILARSWMRVLWACWQHDTAYDPDQHAAARADHSTPAAA